MTLNNSICPLCNSQGEMFYTSPKQTFYLCSNCEGIFLSRNQLPAFNHEKQRYETHKNDVNDMRYQQFVSPIADSILQQFSPTDEGLDFGSGTGPVISKLLQDKNYTIAQYDPFFAPNKTVLKKHYNYIACCEVIEHFHHPKKELALLKQLLKPNGKLYCMTHIYSPEIDFEKWYYKNDFTHVFFYQKKTFEWIKNQFEFSDVTIENRLITFSN